MARDLPLGNGSLLINFDAAYRLRDLYWPHVGQENHTSGHPSRFGVWADGQFRWIDDDGWQRTLVYAEGTLVTRVTLHHPNLGLRLLCEDAVDFRENLYLRRVVVHDETGRRRTVRLFFGQDLHIGGHEVGDSAYYEPEWRAVVHYKGRRWFLINAAEEQAGCINAGVDQWAVGIKESLGHEGSWRDAEDGQLSGNAVAQGSVDSCVALHLTVPAGGSATGWYWIAVGADFNDVHRLDQGVRELGPARFLERTRAYWSRWAGGAEAALPVAAQELYRRSLLILRTQVDHQGAVIAANDFDIAAHYRDTYSYMWPRDGALVVAALIEAGQAEVSRRFFSFCRRVITVDGYLLHRYNPDGSLASSWHARYHEGRKALPVQEDGTALVLRALWRHFERFGDLEFIVPLFRDLLVRAADWLAAYRDPESGLPLASWDLWEERHGVTAWTVATVWAGLQAAARFAEVFGEPELTARYRAAAAEVRAGAEAHLWLPDCGRFARMVNRRSDGGWDTDATIDASLVGLWAFGMFEADDPRVVGTMEAVRERLWVRTDIGGIARYEADTYHRVSGDTETVPGNPWFICTLWLAQWHIAVACRVEDLEPAAALLAWTARRALPSGVMAEQLHPYTGEPLSVSPLTWSHATLVTTVHAYLCRLQAIARTEGNVLSFTAARARARKSPPPVLPAAATSMVKHSRGLMREEAG